MNLKNNNAKKDLRLAHSQGNLTLYLPSIKGMARYLLAQYPNNKPANQGNVKKGIQKRGMIQNPKTRILTRVAL